MTLARRLLSGAMLVVIALVAAIVLIAGGRLRDRLVAEKTDELSRDARMVAAQWHAPAEADAVAQRASDALGYRVTLIDTSGVVLGDSEFGSEARRRLENHATRPEVMAARDRGVGAALGPSASAGDEELYVAVRHPLGTVRVSMTTQRLDTVVRGAQQDVLASGLVALLGVLLLVWVFARTISQPVVELRNVARAIAAGDLTQRPSLAAPGEVGELATALTRMGEQLANRMRALQEDDDLMIALLESLEEGVLALSPGGSVVRINERARGLLNISAPLPFGRELLPREYAIRAAIDQALDGHATPTAEVGLNDRTLAITSRPLPTAGAVLTLLDLTVLRRLETIRRDFVANVSHELKTPLTAVSGFAETLLDDTIPPAQRQRFVETILDNAMRMQRIVDDLLDLSRIESREFRLTLEPLELQVFMPYVLSLFRERAEKKRIRLHARIPQDLPHVAVDRRALEQVVSNLVDNAVKYCPAGAEVVVRAYLDAGTLRVAVEDTGHGIEQKHLPRLFERFYRVDAGRSREVGGTGLGLSIVKHLVEALGSKVSVTSTIGKGSAFAFSLPIVRERFASTASGSRFTSAPPVAPEEPEELAQVEGEA